MTAATPTTLRSMTGLGRGRASQNGVGFVAEVRTVNHRSLEVKVRLPHGLSGLEGRVTAVVRKHVQRGRVDVRLDLTEGGSTLLAPRVDTAAAQATVETLRALGNKLGLYGDLTMHDLVLLLDRIQVQDPPPDLESVGAVVDAALTAAMEDLDTMRRTEGAALHQDMLARVEMLDGLRARLLARAPAAVAESNARLRARVVELAAGVAVDPARLAAECALLADRTDTAEELTRLAGHLDHVRALLRGTEPAGRKLDFLCQELHREANTMASKAQDSAMQAVVVDLKAEIERVREQVQNVE